MSTQPHAGSSREVFSRKLPSLEQIFVFLDDFAGREGLPEPVRYSLALAVEELFTNLVKYHPDGAPDIPVRADVRDGAVTITIEDHDVDRFDITEVTGRDLDKPPRERRPGGLGVHLVKQMVDDFTYDYRDRCGTITIVKLLR